MKKRFLTLLLALALLCSLALPAAALQTQPVEVGSALELAQAMAAPASPRRGLFRARSAAAEPTRVIAFAGTLAGGYGAERVLHLAAWQEYVLEFSDAQTAQRALAQLRTDPNVTDCFLDETFSAEETLSGLWDETPSYSWGGRTMGFTTLRHQAQLLLPAGSGVTVAIIDTGADCTHAMLQGRVSAASYDFANATADVTDINGHGTATAGLVADLTPDAVDVMVLRVYDDNNMSKASRVLTALEYALENGAAVVNLSLGWTNAIEKGYSFLNNVLAQAYASGVVVVAAAGNRGQSNPTGNADDVYRRHVRAQRHVVCRTAYRGGSGLRPACAAGAERCGRAPDALSLCRRPRRSRPGRCLRLRPAGTHAVFSRPAVPGAALSRYARVGHLVA